MHNIKEIRNNLGLFKASLKKRFIEVDVKKILELDAQNRKLIQEKENLEKEKKDISKSKDPSLFKKSKTLLLVALSNNKQEHLLKRIKLVLLLNMA